MTKADKTVPATGNESKKMEDIRIDDLTGELGAAVERLHAIITAADIVGRLTPLSAKGLDVVRGLLDTLMNEAEAAYRINSDLTDARKSRAKV